MNCADCRDNMVACAEGLLDRDPAAELHAHLDACAACRKEYAAITSLQQRLIVRGESAAGVSVADSVMRRVLKVEPERSSFMKTLLRYRWGFGLSAAAITVAALFIAVLSTPNAHAKAVEVMERGANAVARLTSIHIRGQFRTFPQDNFSHIDPDTPFCQIDLWKEFTPELKWRIEKPLRVVVMDGQSTVMFIKSGNMGVKLPKRTTSAFDTDWLHRISNLSNSLTNEIRNATSRGWNISSQETTGADGKPKSVVTILAKSGVPDDDYGKNTFIETADTRRVYRFDTQSGLLEAVEVFLVRPSGEVPIFELTQIDYNPALDPATWKLDLPADVSWAPLPEELPVLPDNEKYASMTAEQAARAFFEACSRQDWTEVGKFMSPLDDRFKAYLGGMEIISIGDSFTNRTYSGRFIPYEIKLHSPDFMLRVSNTNPANRFVITGVYDTKLQPQQQLQWTNPPAVLPDNDAYARLTPSDAVKAYFDAFSRTNWDEMRKFVPDYDVDNDKAQFDVAMKRGLDARSLIPSVEIVGAIWSAEQSSWFVTCRATQVKKWNLTMRNDNPTHRWQFDGGL